MSGMLLVGLGNPGAEYKFSRHNFGFMILDFFNSSGWEKKKNYYYSRRDGFFLVKPRLFMNNSGVALASFLAYHRVKKKELKEKLLVVLDDYQIPFGQARLRQRGSDGGHNGLKSVIAVLATEEFWRLRLGIGPLPSGTDPADFVLENFSSSEQKILPRIFKKVSDWLGLLERYSLEDAASRWENKIL